MVFHPLTIVEDITKYYSDRALKNEDEYLKLRSTLDGKLLPLLTYINEIDYDKLCDHSFSDQIQLSRILLLYYRMS